jgi:hypothetical protein
MVVFCVFYLETGTYKQNSTSNVILVMEERIKHVNIFVSVELSVKVQITM